jgi:sulfur-oxidizing protein SoxB
MVDRREFLVAAAAAASLLAQAGRPFRAYAQGKLTEADLLQFEPLGNVTLLHLTDLHGQLLPVHFREPSLNIGVGEAKGKVPHLVGADLLRTFGITAGSALAHALTHEDFAELARNYGRMGGVDRIATIAAAIRAERAEKVLLLDGGDTWTNSWTSLQTNGQDMVEVMNLIKPDAMTGHWEFTLGEARIKEIVGQLPFPFLAQNIRDTDFEDKVFEASRTFERGGIKIAVIGQAFPFTPISNPRWMIPKWSFGLRRDSLSQEVEEARAGGAHLVVLLSHNGLDVDRKLARDVPGIDVILAGHTHDAVPQVMQVGRTLIVSSGSNGKFLSRLDLDVRDGQVKDYRYRLIPIFADAIKPEPGTAVAIERVRAPFDADLRRVLGRTSGLLYRRGNFDGTLDNLICDSILSERDAEIALSPGVRWGTSILPDEPIRFEDIANATALTYPACYRTTMTGSRLKAVLEDVADNIFNPDPYYQQGGDMVRTGGLGYTIDIGQKAGSRISGLTLLKTGEAIEPGKEYVVSGWASVNEGTEGPPIWDVVAKYVSQQQVVSIKKNDTVKVVGA